MIRTINLSNCDREPIHVPGTIQPFGFLLALLSDFTICIVSQNAAAHLGTENLELMHRPIAEVLFSADALQTIRTRVDYLTSPDAVERIFGLHLRWRPSQNA